LKARSAINRSIAFGREGHLGFLAAFGASGRVQFSRCATSAGTSTSVAAAKSATAATTTASAAFRATRAALFLAAGWASLGVVGKTALRVTFLIGYRVIELAIAV